MTFFSIRGLRSVDRKLKNISAEEKHYLSDRTFLLGESFLKQYTMTYMLVYQLLLRTQSTRTMISAETRTEIKSEKGLPEILE